MQYLDQIEKIEDIEDKEEYIQELPAIDLLLMSEYTIKEFHRLAILTCGSVQEWFITYDNLSLTISNNINEGLFLQANKLLNYSKMIEKIIARRINRQILFFNTRYKANLTNDDKIENYDTDDEMDINPS